MVLKRFLGKPFFVSKKYPVPLALNYEDPEKITKDITKLVNKNTSFYMTHGPNYTIKVARAEMDSEDILKNIINASAKTIPHILKWGVEFHDLKTISLKLTNSIELPIYNQLSPEEVLAYFEML